MDAFETAAHALRATIDEAGGVIPEVTITFESRRDRAYFERTVLRQLDPATAFMARTYQKPNQLELCGVVFKLAVRQVDAA